jgi:hypothetical protein
MTTAALPPRIALRTWLALGLVGIAGGLVLLAVLGPLLTGAIEYRVSATVRRQTVGLDAVSLCLVAPLALTAAALVRRGHVAGPALALPIGLYTAYVLLQYVLGPEYLYRPGNDERLFPLLAALFAMGWMVALAGWRALDAACIPRSARRERLAGGAILPALAFLAFVRYLPALADAMSRTPRNADYFAGPGFFWAIALLDLSVFLPLTVATCAGLVRGRDWAPKALLAVAGWFGLVGPAVAAMAIAMRLGDPRGSTGAAVAMTLLGTAFAGLAVWVFRPLTRA